MNFVYFLSSFLWVFSFFFLKTTPYILPYFHLNVAMFGFFSRFLDAFAVSGGRQVEFQNEEERREAIDHIRLMARRKYLGEREARARWVGVRFTKYKGRTMGEPTRRGQIVYNQWNMLIWQFVSQTYYIINTTLTYIFK